jgi:hypothetical protein
MVSSALMEGFVGAGVQPVSFATLISAGVIGRPTDGTHYAVDKFFLVECLEAYIASIHFDESWYLMTYPDVAAAIAQEHAPDAHRHFLTHGYFENRMPYEIEIDDEWYRKTYPDVDEAIMMSSFASAKDHFQRIGYIEGRLPYPGFELRISGRP